MANVTAHTGPVENIDGKLMLRIPLDDGGSEFVANSRGIGVVEGGFVSIEIMDWLAQKLSISEGSLVTVDNANGKFNIRSSDPSA